MKVFISAILILFSVYSSTADGSSDVKNENNSKSSTFTITGSVSDAYTGEMLVGVEIKIVGTDKKVYTDFDGNFAFDDVSSGKYNILASYISYEKNEITNQEVDVLKNSFKLKLKPLE